MKINTLKLYKVLKIASFALPIILMTIAIIKGVAVLADGNDPQPTGGDPIEDPTDW